MHTDHVNSTSTLLTTVYIISILFFLSFPDFLVIILSITTLGTVHIPCKQCTNMVDHDLHLSLGFFLIFSDFLSIFTWITILGNAHRACTHCTSTWSTSTHHISSFFLTFCWFSHNLCINYYIRKCAQTMWTAPQHYHHHPYFFLILLLFFMWKCNTFHIWHFLAPFLWLDSSVILVTRLHQQYLYISMRV